jgi:hypothetical protein
MYRSKDHADERYHDQCNVQKAEDGLAVVFLELKKAERYDEKEQRIS